MTPAEIKSLVSSTFGTSHTYIGYISTSSSYNVTWIDGDKHHFMTFFTDRLPLYYVNGITMPVKASLNTVVKL